MNALATHFLVEMHECNHKILSDTGWIRYFMITAAEEAGVIVVNTSWNKFNPVGFSGAIFIEKLHLTIHTWPEYNYAAVDIFTCGDVIKPEVAAKYLIRQFESKNPSIIEIKRGLLLTDNEELPYKPVDSYS